MRAFLFLKITEGIIFLLPIKKEETFDSEEELKMLAEIGEEEGTLKQTESDMIQSVFEFKNNVNKGAKVDLYHVPGTNISSLEIDYKGGKIIWDFKKYY